MVRSGLFWLQVAAAEVLGDESAHGLSSGYAQLDDAKKSVCLQPATFLSMSIASKHRSSTTRWQGGWMEICRWFQLLSMLELQRNVATTS